MMTSSSKIIIIITLLVLTLYPMIEVGVTNPDDAYDFLENMPDQSTNEGGIWDKYKKSIKYGDPERNLIRFGGRLNEFGTYLLKPILVLRSGLGDFTIRRVAGFLSLILSIVLFAHGVRECIHSSAFAYMYILLFLTTMQNAWNYSLPISYPLRFHFSLSLFFLSILLIRKSLNTDQMFSKKTTFLEFLSALAYFLPLLIYESFSFYSVILFLFVFFYFGKLGLSPLRRVYLVTRKLQFHIAFSILYLILYFLASAYYSDANPLPKDYRFNWNILASLKVLWQFSVSSLPTYFYFNSGGMQLYAEAFGSPSNSIYHLISQMRTEWIAKGILAGYLAYHLFGDSQYVFKLKMFIWTIVISFLFIVLPIIPLSLSLKYQQWVARGVKTYLITGMAFYGTIFLATSVLFGMKQIVSKSPALLMGFRITLVLFLCFTSVATDCWNRAVTLSQIQSHLRWRAFDEFLKTDDFVNIPSKSIIYAPTLGGRINQAYTHPGYWSSYAKKRTGKSVQFLRELKDLVGHAYFEGYGELNKASHLYFWKYSQERKEPNQFMVFARVKSISRRGTSLCFSSDYANIYSLSKHRELRVFFSSCDQCESREFAVNNKSHIFESTSFLSAFVNAGSARDTLIRTKILAKDIDLESVTLSNYSEFEYDKNIIRVKFMDGFYGLEANGKYNWRWCQESGVLSLTSLLNENVEIELSATIRAMPGSKILIRGPGFSDELVVDNDGSRPYRKKISVAARQEVLLSFESDSRKIKSLSDPRNLVFNLANFEIKCQSLCTQANLASE